MLSSEILEEGARHVGGETSSRDSHDFWDEHGAALLASAEKSAALAAERKYETDVYAASLHDLQVAVREAEREAAQCSRDWTADVKRLEAERDTLQRNQNDYMGSMTILKAAAQAVVDSCASRRSVANLEELLQ